MITRGLLALLPLMLADTATARAAGPVTPSAAWGHAPGDPHAGHMGGQAMPGTPAAAPPVRAAPGTAASNVREKSGFQGRVPPSPRRAA